MSTLRFREDAYARQCKAVVTHVDERGIELDSTVFYPTGGGQPGDAGVLRSAAGDIRRHQFGGTIGELDQA